MEVDESKQARSNILLIAMVMSTLLMLAEVIIGYFQEQIINNSLYPIFLLLPAFSITIQALIIFFFYKTERYELKYVVVFSLVAIVLTGLVFLLNLFRGIIPPEIYYYIMESIEYIFMSDIPSLLIHFLPLLILASAFLIKQEYKFMRNISIVTLIISMNTLLSQIMFNMMYSSSSFGGIQYSFENSNDLFYTALANIDATMQMLSNYTFPLGLLIFTFGLYIDSNRSKSKTQESMIDEGYVYPHEENKTFTKYFSFLGRASRREYWIFVLTASVMFGVLLVFCVMLKSPIMILITFLVAIYMNLCMNSKRLHDLGISGWYQLISLIPIVGAIVLLVKYLQVGQAFDNIYGKNQLTQS